MSRKILFNIHFYLSCFFTPFLMLMAITGTSYLFGFKGSSESVLVEKALIFESGQNKEKKVREVLEKIDAEYNFEYLKDRGSSIQTRPTTRAYYNFKKNEQQTFDLYRVSPNFLSRIIEVHKGHGPGLLKYFEKLLGFSLLLIVLSGFFMALKINNRKKSALLTSSLGALALLALFLL